MNNDKILNGDPKSLARAISLIENNHESSFELIASLQQHTGKAKRIGVTGPPGVGKSTLINEIAFALDNKKKRVGIIGVDPTSPFTGGALLGDRIRMKKIQDNNSIFMRSMATRGSLGGIAQATCEAADVIDASGVDYILIETAGVGQAEIEVTKFIDVTLLILSPEIGDSIQAMKSGIMETADIIVINKKDRPGADKLDYEIRSAMGLSMKVKRVRPIILTDALRSVGIDDVINELDKFISDAIASNAFQARRRDIVKNRIVSTASVLLKRNLLDDDSSSRLENLTDMVLNKKCSLYDAANNLIEKDKAGKK